MRASSSGVTCFAAETWERPAISSLISAHETGATPNRSTSSGCTSSPVPHPLPLRRWPPLQPARRSHAPGETLASGQRVRPTGVRVSRLCSASLDFDTNHFSPSLLASTVRPALCASSPPGDATKPCFIDFPQSVALPIINGWPFSGLPTLPTFQAFPINGWPFSGLPQRKVFSRSHRQRQCYTYTPLSLILLRLLHCRQCHTLRQVVVLPGQS